MVDIIENMKRWKNYSTDINISDREEMSKKSEQGTAC